MITIIQMAVKRVVKKIQAFSTPKWSGFTFIEVVIGLALVVIAVIGLFQLFLLGTLNNMDAGEVTNASFLAQQQIDYLRTLTLEELQAFPAATRGESDDELLDINVDGTPDYRRVTNMNYQAGSFNLEVLIFPASKAKVDRSLLIENPIRHRVRANIRTIIAR